MKKRTDIEEPEEAREGGIEVYVSFFLQEGQGT